MSRTLQVIGLISWIIVGAFLYSAWSMIIGNGFIATFIFTAIWLLPIFGVQRLEEEEAYRSMRRELRTLSESGNKDDRAFVASVNHYNNVLRRNRT